MLFTVANNELQNRWFSKIWALKLRPLFLTS